MVELKNCLSLTDEELNSLHPEMVDLYASAIWSESQKKWKLTLLKSTIKKIREELNIQEITQNLMKNEQK